MNASESAGCRLPEADSEAIAVARLDARGLLERSGRRVEQLAFSLPVYLLFSAGVTVGVAVGLHYVDFLWSDYWEHLAAMVAFAQDPWQPGNPYLNDGTPTHLLTPYHLFWGLLARVADTPALHLTPAMGTVSMLLFFSACLRLSRSLFGCRDYALALAAAMLFLWNRPWDWSGFHCFSLLPLTAMYSYWVVFPAGLHLIVLWKDSRRRRMWLYPVVSVAVPVLFVCHPLTGSFIVLTLTLVGVLARDLPRGHRAASVLLPAACLLLALLWPYFSVYDAVVGSGDYAKLGLAGRYTEFYERVFSRALPALPGAVYCLLAARRSRIDLLSAGLAATVFIYAVNYAVLHNAVLGRYVIYVVLFLQLSCVALLHRLRTHPYRVVAYLAFVAVVVFFGQREARSAMGYVGLRKDVRAGTPLGTHTNRRLYATYQVHRAHIQPDDVVMAPLRETWLLPALLGCKVVASENATPFMHDFKARVQATETFFDDATSHDTRQAILQRYAVRYVLIPKKMTSIGEQISRRLELVGEDPRNLVYVVN